MSRIPNTADILGVEWTDLRPVVDVCEGHELCEPDRHASRPALEDPDPHQNVTDPKH
jgi:hypothetical protein